MPNRALPWAGLRLVYEQTLSMMRGTAIKARDGGFMPALILTFEQFLSSFRLTLARILHLYPLRLRPWSLALLCPLAGYCCHAG